MYKISIVLCFVGSVNSQKKVYVQEGLQHIINTLNLIKRLLYLGRN